MTRISIVLLLSLSALFGQQDWQGEVKQLYPVSIPSFHGFRPVYAKASKTATQPDIEIYSLTTTLGDLKTSAAFFRASLEKQGFKPVKNVSGPAIERIVMDNTARKLTAVVVASRQKPKEMLVGVTLMPLGTLPKN